MEHKRLTVKHWRNLDPWECCGQDSFCKRDCHEDGGCNKGCIVPKLYDRLAAYEDTGLEPEAFQAAMQEFANHLIGYTEYRDIGTVDEIKSNMEMFSAYRHVCGGLPPEKIAELIKAEQKRREGRKND